MLDFQIACAVFFAVFWSVVLEYTKIKVKQWVAAQEWWKEALVPQIQLMHNFGFPTEPQPPVFPEGTSPAMALDAYAFITIVCFHHIVSALLMLPMVLIGWDAASEAVKNLFVIGVLSDVGFDLYDWVLTTFKTFAPERAKKLGATPFPMSFWVILCVLHHPMALLMVIPMNLKFPHLAAYHQTAFSLLMAAGICYATGQCKFALDVKTKRGFVKYKIIVVVQLVTLLYTRVFLWFPAYFSLLASFREAQEPGFFYGGLVLGGVMSLFNVIVVNDAVRAAIKWLPRVMPHSDEALLEAHAAEILQDTAPTSPRGSVPAAVFRTATQALSPQSRVKKHFD